MMGTTSSRSAQPHRPQKRIWFIWGQFYHVPLFKTPRQEKRSLGTSIFEYTSSRKVQMIRLDQDSRSPFGLFRGHLTRERNPSNHLQAAISVCVWARSRSYLRWQRRMSFTCGKYSYSRTGRAIIVVPERAAQKSPNHGTR